MKKIFSLLLLCATAVFASCGKDDPSTEPVAAVFRSLTANGSATETTTTLTLTFDKVIDALTAADVTLSAAETGAVSGALTAKGNGVYELAVSDITKAGNVTVAVAKTGYTITPASKTVAVASWAGGNPVSGDIDMTSMTAAEALAAIRAALAAGFTELKLTGELFKTGMGGQWGTFADNTKIKKCDLTGVTGWGTPATLPDRAFKDCAALQEVTLPGDVRVIGEYAFIRCAALTAVNLSQVTRIDNSAFRECTSLAALTLDHVTAIAADAFFGCTGLETLEIPKCTRFDSYFISGCSSLTRIEATAAGNFVDIDNENSNIEHSAVFHNRNTAGHTGDNAFDPAECDLALNPDKQEGGGAAPTVSNGNEWTIADNARPMQWKSITFVQP